MDYEKKYKEALEWMQSLYDGLHGATKEDAEHYFPELKKNDDERIRKAIIDYLKKHYEGSTIGYGVQVKEVIAWLEKQGEKKHIINVPPREVILSIWDLGNEWKELTNGSISTEYGTQLDYIQKHWHESEYYLKEKQGKQTQLDYEHADIPQKDFAPIEPKFKVGDFITNDYCLGKVIEITNDAYLLDTGQGIPFSCEHNAHLWTIKDAKDGDVLVCDINKAEIGGDVEKLPNITPTICIYQNVVKDKDYIHTYCSLYNESSLIVSNSMYYNTFVYNIHPATKEQQDLLFAKMKEAGYEWDAEKKEVKQIEPKKLDADKVIAWLVANICDFEYYVKLFKKDFGL